MGYNTILSNSAANLIAIQEKSAALTALIITAARENDAKHTLREIYQAISKSGSSHLLVSGTHVVCLLGSDIGRH